MRAAKNAGVLLSYDPNVRLIVWPLPETARQGIKSIWKEADFIKVSDNEVEFLTQGDPKDEDIVRSLWYEGLKLLVVTDGEEGCRYFTKNFKGKVSGFSATMVDTIGAGDAFIGALLFSIAKDIYVLEDDEKLKATLTFANACGAICTAEKGAIPALPSTSEPLDLIAKSKAKCGSMCGCSLPCCGELSNLRSDSDLHMNALALVLCYMLMAARRSSPNVGLTIRYKVLPRALTLIRNLLLQGQALLRFDRIIYNFPHAGFHGKEDEVRLID